MGCSHCHQTGHTYKTCPTITPEEKSAKQRLLKEKKDLAYQRKMKRIKSSLDNQLVNYEVSNTTNYDMVLYWGISYEYALTDSSVGNKINKIYRFDYLNAHSSHTIKCIKNKHIISIFPFLEVQYNDTLNAINEIPLKYGEVGNHNSIIFPHICATNLKMKTFEGTHIIIDSDYKPKKNEIDMWRECALKSKFLLDQIHKMTGGGKTRKEYENIEVFMDMIEDISVPKCSEFEKEIAGVPSLLTNIT
jgi:hypothetical protein